MEAKTGTDFLNRTKYLRNKLPQHRLDWSTKPDTYKVYSVPQKIELPPPQTTNGPGLWDALRKRRSVRAYTTAFLSIETLSQLLWAAQGITAEVGEHKLRTAPSAGALYPIETYVVANRVANLNPGLYHFEVQTRKLALLKEGDFSREVSNRALGQEFMARAAIVFIWTAVVARSSWKYLNRAYRYILLDAGHIAENVALAAAALGLGTCQIGAFFDEELNELLDIDGINESVIYLTTVGVPRAK